MYRTSGKGVQCRGAHCEWEKLVSVHRQLIEVSVGSSSSSKNSTNVVHTPSVLEQAPPWSGTYGPVTQSQNRKPKKLMPLYCAMLNAGSRILCTMDSFKDISRV